MHLERITINPQQCGGRPCIRGLRIRVQDILELLAAGATTAEILEDYPYLEPEDIAASLHYAAHCRYLPHAQLESGPLLQQRGDFFKPRIRCEA